LAIFRLKLSLRRLPTMTATECAAMRFPFGMEMTPRGSTA
jgi:hypothetical protein